MRIDNNTIIGERIYKFRKKMGFTQQQLGELLDLSVTEISNLECGKNNMSYATLVKLCKVLDTCPCQILSGAIKDTVEENIIDLIRELSANERSTLYILLSSYVDNKNFNNWIIYSFMLY